MAYAIPLFDTHKFVRKLKGAGFNEEQAEALTDAVRESQTSADLATKQDVTELEQRVDSKFGLLLNEIRDLRNDNVLLRKDMDSKFDILRTEMAAMKWGLGIIAAGIMAILVKTFF